MEFQDAAFRVQQLQIVRVALRAAVIYVPQLSVHLHQILHVIQLIQTLVLPVMFANAPLALIRNQFHYVLLQPPPLQQPVLCHLTLRLHLAALAVKKLPTVMSLVIQLVIII